MSTTRTAAKPFVHTLVQDSYGKSLVRLTRIKRSGKHPEWKEITVAIELSGPEFARSYYEGDNSKIIATDSMKNTVYVEGSKHSLDSIEAFGLHLAEHFLTKYAHVATAQVSIAEDLWANIPANGAVHPTAFVKAGEDRRLAQVHKTRSSTKIISGLENLNVAKISDSEFSDFLRDEYTTLQNTTDRIFGTKVEALWTYKNESCDFNAAFETVRKVMLATFANHHSLSAQQTLLAMGDAALEAVGDIEEISIVLPNLHRIPFDLRPFGLDNRNEVFVNTSEPHGTIRGTIARKH